VGNGCGVSQIDDAPSDDISSSVLSYNFATQWSIKQDLFVHSCP